MPNQVSLDPALDPTELVETELSVGEPGESDVQPAESPSEAQEDELLSAPKDSEVEEPLPMSQDQAEPLPDWLLEAEEQIPTEADAVDPQLEIDRLLGAPEIPAEESPVLIDNKDAPGDMDALDKYKETIQKLDTRGIGDQPDSQPEEDHIPEDYPAIAKMHPERIETAESPTAESVPEWISENRTHDPITTSDDDGELPDWVYEKRTPDDATTDSEWIREFEPLTEQPEKQHKIPEIQKDTTPGELLKSGDIERSISQYEMKIRSGENLESIIEELSLALEQHPLSIVIWQTLGDAYASNDQLQSALDAYSKAEDLLR